MRRGRATGSGGEEVGWSPEGPDPLEGGVEQIVGIVDVETGLAAVRGEPAGHAEEPGPQVFGLRVPQIGTQRGARGCPVAC